MSLLTLRLSTLLLAVALLQVLTLTPSFAFGIVYPSADKGTYWVTNQTNTLAWSMEADDPPYFSVELLADNSSALAGNFQVGNAIPSVNKTYQIILDLIPSGTYKLLFVNSSNYALDHPQVYYESPSFQLKLNGSAPAQYSPSPSSSISDTASPSKVAGFVTVSSVIPTTVMGVTGVDDGKTDSSNGVAPLLPARMDSLFGTVLSLSTMFTFAFLW